MSELGSLTDPQLDTSIMEQFVTFHIGTLFFGIPVNDVQEVLRFQPMTPVPLSPTAVSGLINLRGQIITAVNMREVLGIPPDCSSTSPMMVVLRTGEETVSIIVDKIGDVLTLSSSTCEAAPKTIAPHITRIVTGIHKLEGKLLLILNIHKCFEEGKN